jgi:antitoxin component of MazEF toxin-antitoxin module
MIDRLLSLMILEDSKSIKAKCQSDEILMTKQTRISWALLEYLVDSINAETKKKLRVYKSFQVKQKKKKFS